MSTVGSKPGLSGALKAAAILTCAVAISFSFARALDIISWSGIYQNRFSFIPGHWYRSQLTVASNKSGDTCVLIGASVVREGFDSDQLSAAVPGVKFVNLATTGGFSPMDVLDIESRILAETGDRYRCIIVGMNNFYMRHFDSESYELVKTDYLSQLPVTALAMPTVWSGGSNKKVMINRLVIPFGTNSVMAQRWWRFGLYELRSLVSPQPVEMARYEIEPNEFTPAVQFQYRGRPSILDQNVSRARAEFVQHQLESPDSYRDPETGKVLNATIKRLSKLSDHIIVVTMPLTSVYRTVEEVAKPAFDEARLSIKEALFVKCDIVASDERDLYYDTSHVNESGREKLSQSLAAVVGKVLHGTIPVGQAGLCATE
jgi:hypothetical protein